MVLSKFTSIRFNGSRLKLRGRFLSLIASAALAFAQCYAQAQEQGMQDPDVVDAFEPIDASAGAFHTEKFKEAERALLEGLSGGDDSDFPEPAAKARLHQVSASANNIPKQAVPKIQEPVAPAEHAPAAPASRKPPVSEVKAKSETKLEPKIEKKIESKLEAKTEAKAEVKPAKPAVAAAAIQTRMVDNEAELRDLRRELANAKSELAAAEMEISRLSAIIQDASRARLSIGDSSSSQTVKPAAKPVVYAPAVKPNTTVRTLPEAAAPAAQNPTSDLQVATIAVDKADLRLGPGKNHSALMSLRRGSRLAVEARQGEWYRVFAPNGQRAWIHSSLVRFGDGAASLNDGSSVQVRGYDANLR
jgi:hypothetical protein